MTHVAAQPLGSAFDESDVPFALVSEMVKLFVKAVRAHQLYLPNNPMHTRAIEVFQSAAEAVWAHSDRLELAITESQVQYGEHTVLEEAARGSDSIPWLFFKDGIRSITFESGVETHDLPVLLDVLHHARQRSTDEDDLVTLFWEHDFAHFQYRYIDVVTDGFTPAPGAALLHGATGQRGTILSPVEAETSESVGREGYVTDVVEPPVSFIRFEDFDTTLYFLDEKEITYLQDAIRDDFRVDLRPSVVSALLDTFEQEDDPNVREEVCEALDHYLLVLLSAMQFGTVAYLLREITLVVGRATTLAPAQRRRLLSLSDRLSEPSVLIQLLQAFEDLSVSALPQDVPELLQQLKPTALAPMLAQLAHTQSAELRTLLEACVTRLAASNTDDLIQLIGSDDDTVALQAIQRSGALQSPATVAQLSKILSGINSHIRRAAAHALAEIGSPGAMQVLERAIDDQDRDIRIVAVHAMRERGHRTALKRVERAIKDRVVHEPPGSEKTAFFDAYALLAGDDGIELLDSILNPHGFFSKKEDSQTRACAASALGKMGSQAAQECLQHAVHDKDIVVRNAAARALRGNV